MFFVVRNEEITPPGTLKQEIAKAATRYPLVDGTSAEMKLWIHTFFAKNRIMRWAAKHGSARRPKVKEKEPVFNYGEYLRSPLWREIRLRILARDEHRCLRCEGVANQVHHLSYAQAVMDGYDDSQLEALCSGCHYVVEFRPDGGRNTPARMKRILAEKDERRDYPEPNLDMRSLSMLCPADWARMNYWQREEWRQRRRLIAAAMFHTNQ